MRSISFGLTYSAHMAKHSHNVSSLITHIYTAVRVPSCSQHSLTVTADRSLDQNITAHYQTQITPSTDSKRVSLTTMSRDNVVVDDCSCRDRDKWGSSPSQPECAKVRSFTWRKVGCNWSYASFFLIYLACTRSAPSQHLFDQSELSEEEKKDTMQTSTLFLNILESRKRYCLFLWC